MEKTGWKIVAIVFIVYSLFLTSIFAWAVYEVVQDEEALKECYYDVCEDYEEAYYELGVCSCYEWDDELWDWTIAKTKILR